MEIFWGVVGVIAWVGWSFTRDRKWQKPILYWFVLVQICLITAILMVKSSQASEQPSAFVDCMLNKTKDIFPMMPGSVLPSLKLQARITERDYKKLAEAVNESPTVIADLELSLEKAKSPSNPDSIIMKELTRQCSKNIKWKKKGG
jgi:hypothetical protein